MVLQRLILGFLALKPMSGYDLTRRFANSVNHFWSADKAQIYRALAVLAAEGWVDVTTVPGAHGPMRHEHRITPAGRRVLREWLTGEPERQAARSPFLARVYFAAELSPAEAGALVASRREEVCAHLATLTAIADGWGTPDDRASRLRRATLDNGLRHARAELEWLDDLARVVA